MEIDPVTQKTLSFDQLVDLRRKTEEVSRFLENQLRGYLGTLQPLLNPKRLLGRYVGGKEDVTGSSKVFAQIQEKFKAVCQKPFGLPAELTEESFLHIENRVDLQPWEYLYEAHTDGETKNITMTSPVRWVLTYRSDFTLRQVREALGKREDRHTAPLRQFVVNALVMHAFFSSHPNLQQLFQDLRFTIQMDPPPVLGTLPFISIASNLPSFRPPDDLILTASRLSGVPAFIELIDPDGVSELQDPFKANIQELLR